jgi:maltose O-acetyltransferase
MFPQLFRVLFYRLASLGTQIEGNPRRCQPLLCHGRGQIRFGRNVQFGFFPSPSFTDSHCFLDARGTAAIIQFADDITVNNGFTAIAEACLIKIGNRVLIGPHVMIVDSDFHGLDIAERNNPDAVKRGDVVIEDDAFIGYGVTILKGVRIGKGSVVAAGSLVNKDIEAGVIAGGNPAKTLRSL